MRRLKRRVVRYRPDPQNDESTIRQGLEQIACVASAIELRSAVILEIGSGWQPMIPILYSLAGARRIIMTDLTRLCDTYTFQGALESLRSNQALIADRLHLQGPEIEGILTWNAGETIEESFKRLRITYMAPCDLRRTGLPPGSLDVVVSRAVLEHIPPGTIREIFSEMRRILRPGGVMYHLIDNSDHWEHGDKSISKVNFLQFSEPLFRWASLNGQNYQNRLRHPEYARCLEEAGFGIVREDRVMDEASLRILPSLRLARRFAGFSHEDLATITSVYVARKRAE